MRWKLLGSAGLAIVAPGVACAQATSAPEATSAAPSSAAAAPDAAATQPGLGEIVVTAQRTRENLQRAAVAVDVVQGTDLISAGITQPDRLQELIPALTVQPTSTGNILFVRGVGNFTVVPTSDPAIAFNYDGVYIGRPSSTTGVFYDLERIEVLKGPQGTLYGRNATGGAINILPVQPKLGELSGYGSFSYGNYDAITAEGAVNAPLGDKGAVRISGTLTHHDGYLRDGSSDDKTRGVRAQVKYEITPNLTVRLSGDYAHNYGVGSGVSYQGVYNYNPVTRGYTFVPSGVNLGDGIYTPAAQAFRQTVTAGTAGRKLDALTPYPGIDNEFVGTNAQIDWQTDIGTLTVIPAYRHAHLNELSEAASFLYDERERDEQFSVEARMVFKRFSIFDTQVGFYYFDENIHGQTALSLSSALTLTDPNLVTHSYAPFGRVTAHVTDKLRLVGGIRYTDDHKRFDAVTNSGAIVCLAPSCPRAQLFPLVTSLAQLPFNFPPAGVPAVPQIVGGIPTGAIVARIDRDDNSRLTNSKVTYRAAAEYDLAPQSLLYASYETGYRSGGFSAATGFETYQPEYLDAYTVGLKNRFLNNRVQLNIEAFYWKYKNQQVNHVGLDLDGRTSNITQNIGRSRISGAEVEGRVLATPTTLLSGDVQYLNTKDKSFSYLQPAGAGGTPPLTGCPSVQNSATAYTVNCKGFPAYNSPKWTFNLAGQQTVKLGDYQLVFGLDTQYRSSRYIGFFYLPQQLIRTHWDSNAQVTFGPSGERWTISGFIRNIEDHRIPDFSSTHPTTNILISGTTQPRTYGVRVSAKF